MHPVKKHYQEGEVFWYLGEQYALTFSSGFTILFKENKLYFPRALQFRIQKELQGWYIHEAQIKISERVEFHANKMEIRYSGLLFSDTKSKWGTCFADNSLQFSWKLIMTPLLVMDYVIIHELSHITHKNHSADFWRRVARFTPAFRQHRKWLNAYGHLLVL